MAKKPITPPPSDLLFGCTASGATHHDLDISDIATKVQMVKDAGVFDYIDRCPPDEEFRDLLLALERREQGRRRRLAGDVDRINQVLG